MLSIRKMESMIRTLAQHPSWAHLLHYTHFTFPGPHGTHERKQSLKKPSTLLQGTLLNKPGYACMCSFSPRYKSFGQDKPLSLLLSPVLHTLQIKPNQFISCLGLHRQVIPYKQRQEKLGHPALLRCSNALREVQDCYFLKLHDQIKGKRKG